MTELQCFEVCPFCCHRYGLEYTSLKPMVLSGDDKQMQCGMCNASFKVPDSALVLEMARRQREAHYDN